MEARSGILTQNDSTRLNRVGTRGADRAGRRPERSGRRSDGHRGRGGTTFEGSESNAWVREAVPSGPIAGGAEPFEGSESNAWVREAVPSGPIAGGAEPFEGSESNAWVREAVPSGPI